MEQYTSALLGNYRKPSWIEVRREGDGTHVFNSLLNRRYTLTGRLAELLQDLMAYQRAGDDLHLRADLDLRYPDVADVASASRGALDALCQKGIIQTNDTGEDELPALIPTAFSLLGAAGDHDAAAAGDIVFFGAPCNVGNRTTTGTIAGPDALRQLSSEFGLHPGLIQLDAVAAMTGIRTMGRELDRPKEHSRQLFDAGNIPAYLDTSPQLIHQRIERAATSILKKGSVPFMTGGDHSASIGALRACARAHERFNVIHLDAHTDCYRPRLRELPDFSGHPSHANFMSWALSEISGIAEVHQFGIRGIGNISQRESPKQHIHFLDETRRCALPQGNFTLPGELPCYLTLDIDVLDPSVVPGTASPVPNGLQAAELLQLLYNLIRCNRVVAVDIVELDVGRDRDKVTQTLVLDLIAMISACLHADVGGFDRNVPRTIDDSHAEISRATAEAVMA